MHETQVCRRASLNIEYFEPRYSSRTSHWMPLATSYIFHRLTKNEQQTFGKMFLGPSLIFTVTFNKVRSSCGINDGVESICNS